MIKMIKLKPHKTLLQLLLVISLSLPLAACTGQKDTPLPTLRVEWTIWQGDYTLLVAQEKGLFEKHGVKVEPVYYENFSEALPDLAGARIDIGLFGMVDALNVANLIDLQAIAVYDSGGVTSLVAAPTILSAAGLAGNRIGVAFGTSSEMVIHTILEQASLTSADVTLVNLPVSEIPAHLQSGNIQAGVTYEPYTSQAVKNGSQALAVSGVSQLLPDLIVARRNLAEQHPQLMTAFLAAWFEAVQYRLENPLESNQIIANYTGVPATQLLTGDAHLYTLADNQRLYTDENAGDELSIYQTARTNLDFLVASGSLTNLLDIRTIFSPAYLPKPQTAAVGQPVGEPQP